MRWLSTHILDTAHRWPDAGTRFYLIWQERVATADGRAPGEFFTEASYTPGRCQLVYPAAAYCRTQGVTLPEPPFRGEVTLNFGLAYAARYHTPLLVSPFGYTSYRVN